MHHIYTRDFAQERMMSTAYGHSDYGYYGSGGSYYGGYASYGPGGYLDARTELNGPGSLAYVHEGANTSYAYEGQNGSVFELNTTTFDGGSEQSTSYHVSDAYHSDSQLSDLTRYDSPVYGTSGPASSYDAYSAGSYGRGLTSVYSAVDIETSTSGAYETISSQHLTSYGYADGTYRNSYSSDSGTYTDGSAIPGTHTSYSSTSYSYAGSYTG